MSYQIACYLSNESWAPTAVVESNVSGTRIGHHPITNSVRVRVSETIDRLVVVTNNANVCDIGKESNNSLFRFIQVLVLVYQDVGEFGTFFGSGVGHKKVVKQWYDFTYQHCFMEAKPIQKLRLESCIRRCYGVSGILVLKARPSGFVCFA